MSQIWERQSKESYQAWEAFVIYRDMGVSRTLRETAATLKKSLQLLEGWSSKHAWVARCKAWDAFLDAEMRRGMMNEVQRAGRRQARIAVKMQEKVELTIDKMGTEQLLLSSNQIASWFDAGVKVERLALGLTTENVGKGLLSEAEADAIIANIIALVGGLVVYVPEDKREEYRAELAAGVARLLGRPNDSAPVELEE